MESTYLANLVQDKLEEVRTSSSRLRNFFGILNKVSKADSAVFGGAVRDWYLGYTPKDIDIVIDGQESKNVIELLSRNFKHDRSQFDGYHFEVSGIHLDIWRLQDSWYFRDRVVPKYWDNLAESTPFDVDAILVFRNGAIIDKGFLTAIGKRQIELQNMINKDPKVHIFQRALRFRKKYGFTFGPKLEQELQKYKEDSQSGPFKKILNMIAFPYVHRRSSN